VALRRSHAALAAALATYAVVSAFRLPSDVIRDPTRVVASSGGACAFWKDRTMRCWGHGPFADHHGDRPWAHPSPRAPLRDVALTSSPQYGRGDDCVLTAQGSLECARADAPYVMDFETQYFEYRWFPPLQTPPELHDVRSAWVARTRVCVLARAGAEPTDSVWCVDRESVPQKDAPVVRAGFRRMPLGAPLAIAMGQQELCARYAAGPVRCIDQFRGELRDVAGTEGAVQLVVAEDFGCVRDARGAVSCWGNNVVGQLGDGTLVSRREARPIALTGSFGDVAAFGRRACVVRDGVPWCWGRLRPRESLPELVSAEPVEAADLSRVRTLAIADWFACATRTDGTVWCWGNDAAGQLGNGASMPSRGCGREGISGTSPEQEQLQPPTPVRTGEAGGYPRARGVLAVALLALVLAPLAWALRARKRSSLHGWAAFVVATFAPIFVLRLSNAAIAAHFDICRGWGCEFDWTRRLDAPLFAAGALALSLACVVFGHRVFRRATDPRRGARRMALVLVCAAIPWMLASMVFTKSINDSNSTDGLAYLLRDRALEQITWPFVALWWSTLGWFVLVVAFALFTWTELERPASVASRSAR